MSSPFDSARIRLRRAKTHIRDLERGVARFINSRPYRHVIDEDNNGSQIVHKLKAKRKTLPTLFSSVSADAIENLRAALEHAVYVIAIKHGIPCDKLENVHFPFSAKSTDFQSRITGCCPQFPKEILALLSSFQPYHGGNNILWAMNEICKINKHHYLSLMAFNIEFSNVHALSGFSGSLPHSWDRANNEIILGTEIPDMKIEYEVELKFSIGFDNIPVISGKPIIGLLYEMASIVDGIIAGLEAESRRIGLI